MSDYYDVFMDKANGDKIRDLYLDGYSHRENQRTSSAAALPKELDESQYCELKV